MDSLTITAMRKVADYFSSTFIGMFALGHTLGSVHRPDVGLLEIVDEKAGKDYLKDKLQLFDIEMHQIFCVFQNAEESLDVLAWRRDGRVHITETSLAPYW